MDKELTEQRASDVFNASLEEKWIQIIKFPTWKYDPGQKV